MHTMAPPDRSLEQRHSALSRANDVRCYRSREKAKLKRLGRQDKQAAREQVAQFVLNPPSGMLTMRVLALLEAPFGMGATKAHRMMRKAGVSPAKTVGGLTMRQRVELANELRNLAA